ncbi:glycosyltransferase family 2 protein [Mucilaginibacter sp. AW1-7]|uniref:glycosyltransferase family 2 protein n=1 Tax=Mucilaginibacter sp. AW1-7 TaxID=3349874 RepID=UPI003F734486
MPLPPNQHNIPEQLPCALLVPCFNAARYIGQFLQNLSALHRPFDEVIFFDDASTDGTAELLTARGFRVIHGKENRGPGFARNRLAEAASSPYIHFHDIDDEFNPSFLILTGSKLASADVVLGFADWIDAATRQPVIQWRYEEGGIAADPLAYFVCHPLGVINTVYKKAAFLAVQGFSENINCWEDADLHIRLAASGARFALVTEVLAYSLRHDRGISRDQSRCWHCRLLFLDRYLAAYRNQVGDEIFTNELQRAKNGLLHTGAYRYLGEVISIKKKHHLPLETFNIAVLHHLSRLLPPRAVSLLVRSAVYLKKKFPS